MLSQKKKQTNKKWQTAFDNQMEYNLIMLNLTLMITNALERYTLYVLEMQYCINCFKDC